MNLLKCTTCCLINIDLIRKSKNFSKLIREKKFKLILNNKQLIDALMLLL